MNEPYEPNRSPELPLDAVGERISDAELAGFLQNLASVFSSPKLGNPQLSIALSELALWVSTREQASTPPKLELRREKLRRPTTNDLSLLKSLSRDAVEHFLTDERKTKLDLIDLAYARFSIARAQLKRMKADAVRETIRTALLNEGSIEIISQEARRDGLKRSS